MKQSSRTPTRAVSRTRVSSLILSLGLPLAWLVIPSIPTIARTEAAQLTSPTPVSGAVESLPCRIDRGSVTPVSGIPITVPGETLVCLYQPYSRTLVYENDRHELHYRHSLDLYVPRDRGSRLSPVVMYIHGGAWAGGSKEACEVHLASLLTAGFAVACVDYRLSVPDTAPFPAQIHDVKGAVRWLRANAQRFHLDRRRFAAMGHSAGGHLTSLLATSGGVSALEGTIGENLKQSSRVQAAVPISGPSDLLATDVLTSYMGECMAVQNLLTGGLPLIPSDCGYASVEPYRSLAIQANPITHLTSDDPPMLMIHGTEDMTVPFTQSETLYWSVRDHNLSAALLPLPGADHDLQGAVDFLSIVNIEVPAYLQRTL